MKIAIHHIKGSFSDRWIEYCITNSIDYKLVNCYASDIIFQLSDCDALMWHHHHCNYKDVLFAKQLTYSLETSGKTVFPDFKTVWHFDDKVGQKYLLESIGAPLVNSYVFYTKKEAIYWIKTTTFPKVFKLRGGAGSANVKLIKSKRDAFRLAHKAFNNGFPQFNPINYIKDKYKKYKTGSASFGDVCKSTINLFITNEFAKMHGREKGYMYFQDFIPNNTFDIRVIVIGNKAFALKRMTRENDFRASGSGKILYGKTEIDERCIQIAFDVSKKLKSQSIAYDFVFDMDTNPLILELSYGYDVKAYDPCPGYWDADLKWHNGNFNPQSWMVENMVFAFEKGQSNLNQ